MIISLVELHILLYSRQNRQNTPKMKMYIIYVTSVVLDNCRNLVVGALAFKDDMNSSIGVVSLYQFLPLST